MSKTHRTEHPRVAARRRLPLVIPRIVVRRPHPGDRHPLTASVLRRVLRKEIPAEYLHGLSRIELRARTAGSIGMPFGCYLRDEKAILLYSLPDSWVWDSRPAESLIAGMQRYYAFVREDASGVHVAWPAPEVLSFWFFIEVFAHELGHHYQHQYRARRSEAKSRRHDELVAELHSARFRDVLMRK